MKKIWKYELPSITKSVNIPMPLGSKILTVQEQHNKLRLWVEVNPSEDVYIRHFILIETGHREIPETSKYIGTVQLDGGSYVLHVYEVI